MGMQELMALAIILALALPLIAFGFGIMYWIISEKRRVNKGRPIDENTNPGTGIG